MHYTTGPEKLIIGKFCALFIFGGTWLEMTAEFLPRIHSRDNTVIGNDVWIGWEAVVTPGDTIGDGAIIATRAVVVSDIAPYTTVGGNPARPLNKRDSDEDIDRCCASPGGTGP